LYVSVSGWLNEGVVDLSHQVINTTIIVISNPSKRL